MSDLVDRLVGRALGVPSAVRPRVRSAFESLPARDGEALPEAPPAFLAPRRRTGGETPVSDGHRVSPRPSPPGPLRVERRPSPVAEPVRPRLPSPRVPEDTPIQPRRGAAPTPRDPAPTPSFPVRGDGEEPRRPPELQPTEQLVVLGEASPVAWRHAPAVRAPVLPPRGPTGSRAVHHEGVGEGEGEGRTVEVNIGRVEVSAVLAAPPSPPRPAPAAPRVGLDDYLRARRRQDS